MKKTNLILLIYFIVPSIIYAQGWELSFGSGGGDDNRGFDIIQTQDSAFVVVSRINCDTFFSDCQAAISKISQAGNVLWTELIFPDTNTFVNSVVEDSNGDLIITGRVPIAQGGQHLYVNKMNANGELIWSRLIGDLPDIDWVEGNKVLCTEDNRFLIMGTVRNPISFKNAVLLAEFDQLGDEIWREIYWYEKSALPKDMILDTQGDIYLIGSLFDFPTQDFNYLFMKIGSQGQVYVEHDIGEPNIDKFLRNMSILEEEIVYFTGSMTIPSEVFIVKMREDAQIEFEKNISNVTTLDNILERSEDDQLYLLTEQNFENRLLKLDEFGDIIWNKLIPEPYFETTFRTLKNFKQTFDGGFIICGYTLHMDSSSVYIIRLDKNGNLVNTINLDQIVNNPVEIYPNPSNNFINIELSEFTEDLVLEVFNESGKTIDTRLIKSSQTFIDIHSYINGLYFYKIKRGQVQIGSGRFIKIE